jgi:putative transposase
MNANQACFPIAFMARVLGVSKAGDYAWRHRPPSAHARADEALLARIKTVHLSSRQTYGAPRVHAELRGAGERHGRKRIARLMRAAGLVGASRRRGGPITTRRDKQARPAPDLVDRDFRAAGPNQLWVADITPAFAGAGSTSRRRRASSIWRLSSMSGAAGSSAGRWPITCEPSWFSTPSTWPSASVGRAT